MTELYFCYPLTLDGVQVAEIEGYADVDHRGEISDIELVSMLPGNTTRVDAPGWLTPMIMDYLVDERLDEINEAMREARYGEQSPQQSSSDDILIAIAAREISKNYTRKKAMSPYLQTEIRTKAQAAAAYREEAKELRRDALAMPEAEAHKAREQASIFEETASRLEVSE